MATENRNLRPYHIATKFGHISILAYDIADARRDARVRFGITNPRATRATIAYRFCDACLSAPCAGCAS